MMCLRREYITFFYLKISFIRNTEDAAREYKPIETGNKKSYGWLAFIRVGPRN